MIDNNIERLKKILVQESPILFLGAGFSYGAYLKTGTNIPLGNKLKDIIIKDLLKISASDAEYEELNDYSLKQVCDYYEHSFGKEGLYDFLTDMFSDVVPSEEHFQLTNYQWKKIYTTNIDDLVEQVYARNKQTIIPQHSPRKTIVQRDSATHYFKLHGSVRNPSEGFVFSTESYVNSVITSNDFRFSTLATDMHSEHFIFLGSNFEEFNIDYYLKLYENTGYASSRGKLFFINPKPSALLRKRIERVQGVLIEWDTNAFLQYITDLKSLDKKTKEQQLLKEVENMAFYNLSSIKNSSGDLKDYQSRLYLGYEPTWEDIFTDWDFVNKDLIREFLRFLKNLPTYGSGIFSLIGKAYVGKSTFLKRLALHLLSEGYEVFNYSGRYFNFFPFFQYLKKSENKKFALIVDNASYNYTPINQLLDMLPKSLELIVITAARPYSHFRYRYSLVGNYFYEYEFDNYISEEYSGDILKKLEEKGYLGELSQISSLEERRLNIQKNNDVVSTLYGLTYGQGFIKRLNKNIQPLLKEDSDTKDLLISCAIFNRLELPDFPIELVSQLTNNKGDVYIKKIEDYIKYTNPKNIQIRSTFLSQTIFSTTSKKRILQQIERILIVISSQIDDNTHTYWNEIHAGLTREKSLRKTFAFSSSEIQKLLYGLRIYYNSNFNYWIQLGISEQREKNYEKALNHFKIAESLRQNSYMVQNAIGRNFLKQANSLSSYNLANQFFIQGEKILTELIEKREEYQARTFATHCLLYEKINFVKKFKIEISNNEIQKMFGYLEKIVENDPNDIMARHINNVFYKFLRDRGKLNLIKIRFEDLSRLKYYLSDSIINEDSLLDEIEIE